MNYNKSVMYKDVEKDLHQRSEELVNQANDIINEFSTCISAHKGSNRISIRLVLDRDEFGLPVVQWYDSRKNTYLPEEYVLSLAKATLSAVPWLQTLLADTHDYLSGLRNEVEFLANICRKISFWKKMDAKVLSSRKLTTKVECGRDVCMSEYCR